MEFKDDAQLDSDSVRRGRSGGKIALGGGAGMVVLLVALFLGVDPSMLLGPAPSEPAPAESSHCRTGADVERDPECRWTAYATSVNQFWGEQLDGYEKSSIIAFSGHVDTGCGTASSQTGPFYCPPDRLVYVDTDFLGRMLEELGTQSSLSAEAYIVAHEYGHHAQELMGILAKSRQGDQEGADSAQVRLELQADCFAGAYLRWAADNPQDVIEDVTDADVRRAQDAARVVGDDAIQARSGEVNPDAWTHGSSEMRQRWLNRGLESGDPNQCDTFSARQL